MNHQNLEKVLKALANRRRLAILKHLKSRSEASVSDIAAAIELSVKATSKHLAILSAAGVVEWRQQNLFIFYRLAPRQESFIAAVISEL